MTDAIGILGGSFDPIHVGHLQLARDAMAAFSLREVRFIPAAAPWQKSALTDAAHRAHMVELAIAGEPRFTLDMREIERGGTSYTIDTLRELRAALPDARLVLIIGADQFEHFDTWRGWQEISPLATIAVARRAGAPLQPGSAGAALLAGGQAREFAMTAVDASSTDIRRRLHTLAVPNSRHADPQLERLIPPAVLDYIRLHHLYLDDRGH